MSSAGSTLLDTILRSRSSVLIFGANEDVHRALRAGLAGARPLDLRTEAPSEAELNRAVSERIADDPTLLVWLGASVDDATRGVLSQVLEGQLADGTVRDDLRVVALAPARPDEPVASMFAMVMSAEGATVAPVSEVE
ncbi:MAG: hypothetical protein RIT81_36745 [Deltaproteobacteria bacterium]